MRLGAITKSSVLAAWLFAACSGGPERAPHVPIRGVDTAQNVVDNPHDQERHRADHPGATGDPDNAKGPASPTAPAPASSTPFLDAFLDTAAAKILERPGIVAVFPALSADELRRVDYVSGLGQLLMDETAKGLERRGVASVLSGAGLINDLLAKGHDAGSLRGPEDAFPLASAIDADYVVFGRADRRVFDRLSKKSALHVDWYCHRLADRRLLASFSEDLSGEMLSRMNDYHRLRSTWRLSGQTAPLERRTSRETTTSHTADRGRLAVELPEVRWPAATPPEPGTHTARIEIPAAAAPAVEGVSAEPVTAGSRVVIAVPATPNAASPEGELFRTEGYFNRAEQYLEMALTRRGLRVVDRTAFEAEVRAMAEAQGKAPPARLEDVAELVRAAGSPDLGADYVLQVNGFHVGIGPDLPVDLRADEDYAALAAKAPGAELPAHYALPGFVAEIHAKLFAVQTGTIVWNGRCRADVRSALDADLAVEIEVAQTARDARRPSRRELEADLDDARKAWQGAREQLREAYDSGDRERIARAEEAFDSRRHRFHVLAAAASDYSPQWRADYDVRVREPRGLPPRGPAEDEQVGRRLAELAARALLDNLQIEGE